MRKIRRDEHGLSLIELLVAVAILGVITVPMLQGFIVTHRTTMKALELQNATMAAQNIMETLHAQTVEETKKLYGEGVTSDGVTTFVYPDAMQGGSGFDVMITLERPAEDMTYAAPACFDEDLDRMVIAEDAVPGTDRHMSIVIDEPVRNYFFYYRPDYDSTDATYDSTRRTYRDTIRIDNPSDYPVRIHIIKLKSTAAGAEVKERAYRVRVDASAMRDASCEIYTNLNTNTVTGERLAHQAYASENCELLPLYGASSGAGSFYETTVSVYEKGALAEGRDDAVPIVRISTKEDADA